MLYVPLVCNPPHMRILFLIFLICFEENVFAQSSVPVDSATFESPSVHIRIDTSAGNIWHIGKPQKFFFNSAHSPTHAIVTDTVGISYPGNNNSSFIYVLHNSSPYNCGSKLCFWHKYDMELGVDEGVIDASYNGGVTWDTLINIPPVMHLFAWEPDYHESTGNLSTHNILITGTSDGWIKSCFYMQWALGEKVDTIPVLFPDSILIRFTFKSNATNNNYEGWMIDDIVLDSLNPNDCAGGIKEYVSSEPFFIYPNPSIEKINLEIKNSSLRPNSITIYNLLSQQVLCSPFSSQEKIISLNIKGLVGGIYFVEIASENGKVYRKKFVKE